MNRDSTRLTAAALLCLLLAGCVTVVQPPPPREAAPADFPENVYLEAAPTTPVYRIDPSRSLIQVYVYREGALAKLGHDHVVASREVRGYALLPADPAQARADFYFPVFTLSMDEPELRRSAGFSSEITADDLENTRLRMLRLLEAEKHPYARIHAVRAVGTPPDLVLDAELTLHGVTRALNIPAKLKVEGNRFSVEGETDILQTDYGITPFSVLGGALAVKDPLRVIFRIEGVRVGPVPWQSRLDLRFSRRDNMAVAR